MMNYAIVDDPGAILCKVAFPGVSDPWKGHLMSYSNVMGSIYVFA